VPGSGIKEQGNSNYLVNDEPAEETFGTKGDELPWHDGGLVDVSEKTKLVLHDLTGFDKKTITDVERIRDLNLRHQSTA
jgi:hypothetical protein